MGYRRDIDGLRAVAVLAVLFYHAHLGCPGGFVGVDVFFVISGFLITDLLHRAISTGTFSYAEFWERRVRRLAPALAALTVFVGLTAPLVLLPEDLKDLGGNLIAQPLLLANVYFWRMVKGGYFSDAPEIRPLLHTWSLGVEEQFYLVFPIGLVLLHSYFGRRTSMMLATLLVLSAASSVVLTPVRQSFCFFNLPTRAWELLLGALLVFVLRWEGRRFLDVARLRTMMAWAGLGLIAWPVFFYWGEMPFPGSAAMVPCLGTALLILANSSGTWVGRRLTHPVMVRTGQISYSLYLWHWTLIAYGTYLGLLSSQAARLFVVILSCLAGYASWLWIETPIRERRWMPQGQSMVFLFLAYAMFTLSVGSLYLAEDGFPQNWSPGVRPQDFRTMAHDADPMQEDARAQPLGDAQASPCRFLLWGDSHAMSLAPLLNRLGQAHHLKGLCWTASSSAPLFDWGHEMRRWDKSPEYKARWRELVLKTLLDSHARTVFLSGYWSSYCRPQFPEDLAATVEALNRLGVQVVFVCDFPSQPGVNSRNLRLASRWPALNPVPSDEARYVSQNAGVKSALERIPPGPDFLVVNPADIVLRWSRLTEGDRPLYVDSHHLSDEGAFLLRPLFEPLFKKMEAPVTVDLDE